MSDPFYLYPSETTKRLDALLGEPILGPKEWFCARLPDRADTPEEIHQGVGQSMQLDGRKGTYRTPQPFFPECPTCPQLKGMGPIHCCDGHGKFMQRRE